MGVSNNGFLRSNNISLLVIVLIVIVLVLEG